MHVMYTAEETERVRARTLSCRTMMRAIAAAAFALCVAICFFVRTGNAARLQGIVIAVSTLSGWTVILLRAFCYVPGRALYTHMEGTLAAQCRDVYEGTITLERGTTRLPRSIWIRRVTLTDGEERIALSVLAEKARELPPDGTRVRVETVRKYIMGWEACRDQT